ncbi:MAG: acyl transferase [Saprospiraceae bacterium]|nr:acyl transferase [Saprospiraceae bacterium]
MNMTFEQERKHILTQFSTINTASHAKQESYILNLFHFQYKYNVIYQEFCKNLKLNPKEISQIASIPFLPITAFKHHAVKTGDFDDVDIFISSGTLSAALRSKHYVRDLEIYRDHTVNIWSKYFQSVEKWCFLALLPDYLERNGSSLVNMVDHFISLSNFPESGLYLRNHEALYKRLCQCKAQNIPTVLFGVTYALLDFLEHYQMEFPELIIIETGGMKGKRKEIIKNELHSVLKKGFNVDNVYSEYGMTELFSQAYAMSGTTFLSNEYIKIIIKQRNDPLSQERIGKAGILSIIDCANIDSCAFIQTEDIGIAYADGSFEVVGRLEDADVRGCNLMVQDL